MPIVFEPLPRETAVDQCTAAIRQAILSGALVPGSQLPPERTLADSFGVNRVTVRSALSRLAGTGLLAVRQGSGYTVRDFRRAGGPDLLPGIIALSTDESALVPVCRDLLLVRRQLARAVLTRLAERARRETDDTWLAPIAGAVDRFMAAALDGELPQALALLDGQIITEIVAAAESAVLSVCLNPVLSVVAGLPALCDALYAHPVTNVAGYRTLLDVLRAGDGGELESVVGVLEQLDEQTLERMKGSASRMTLAPRPEPR